MATICGAAWSVGIFYFLHSTSVEELSIAFKILYSTSDIMIWAFLVFACYTVNYSKWRVMTVVSAIVTLAVVLWIVIFNGLFVESFIIGTPNIAVVKAAPYSLYALYFLIYSVTIVALLARSYRKSQSTIEKKRTIYMLVAYVVALLFGALFNLILPWMGNYTLIWVGPISVVIFAAIVSTAIVRYRLFNVGLYAVRLLIWFAVAVIASLVYSLVSLKIFSISYATEASLFVVEAVATLIFLIIVFLPLRVLSQSSNRWLEHGLLDNRLSDQVFRAALATGNTHKTLKDIIRIISKHTVGGYGVAAIISEDSPPTIVGAKNLLNFETIRKIGEVMDRNDINTLVTEETSTADATYELLRKYDISIVVRALASDNKRMGNVASSVYLMICRDKPVLYSDHEISTLLTTCDTILLATENTLHYEQIQSFNQELETRVKSATAGLRISNRELKKLDSVKDDFISMASHQLRTPLTSIKGYISMLLDGDFGKLTTEQRRILGDAYLSSERMVFIIGDFLDLSRLQTGKFELQKTATHLDEILNSEISQLTNTANSYGVELIYEPVADLPIVVCDQNKVRQVMMNLIDNAIFYSHAGQQVEISLYQKDQKNLVFTVRDHGIGVPRAERPRLFEKFFRASNARKARPDGTGVGLYMARKIVTAHGGSIIFESHENVGSTFGFRLPINKTKS